MSRAPVDEGSEGVGDPSILPPVIDRAGLRVRTLRPRRTLGWSIGLPIAALALPLLCLALWVLYRPGSTRPFLLVGVLAVLIAGAVALAFLQYRRTRASVSAAGIVERGFFGGTKTIAARDISGVLRVQLYRGASSETSSQLFVVDRRGHSVFRMRGGFWDEETMNLVAPVLGVDEVVREEPVTMAELRRSDPRLLYWFERRPKLRAEDDQSVLMPKSGAVGVLEGSSTKPSRS